MRRRLSELEVSGVQEKRLEEWDRTESVVEEGEKKARERWRKEGKRGR